MVRSIRIMNIDCYLSNRCPMSISRDRLFSAIVLCLAIDGILLGIALQSGRMIAVGAFVLLCWIVSLT